MSHGPPVAAPVSSAAPADLAPSGAGAAGHPPGMNGSDHAHNQHRREDETRQPNYAAAPAQQQQQPPQQPEPAPKAPKAPTPQLPVEEKAEEVAEPIAEPEPAAPVETAPLKRASENAAPVSNVRLCFVVLSPKSCKLFARLVGLVSRSFNGLVKGRD